MKTTKQLIARLVGGTLALGTLYWSMHTWMYALLYWLTVTATGGSMLGVFLGVVSMLVLAVAHIAVYFAVLVFAYWLDKR